MNIFKYTHRVLIRIYRIGKQRLVLHLTHNLLTLKYALAQEKQETKDMLATYKRYTQKQASKEELSAANKQFTELLKGIGLGIFAILPFAPITIPLVIKLGKVVGIELLPSSFNNISER